MVKLQAHVKKFNAIYLDGNPLRIDDIVREERKLAYRSAFFTFMGLFVFIANALAIFSLKQWDASLIFVGCFGLSVAVAFHVMYVRYARKSEQTLRATYKKMFYVPEWQEPEDE